MEKIDARTKYEKKNQKIVIAFFVLFILLMSVWIILQFISQETKEENLTYESLSTIEDVLKYYDCKYISEKQSTLEDYKTDIKLVFKYDLYEEDISNEDFFNNLIKDMARVLGYSNFRMIDEEKNIDIKVKCANY